MSAIYLTEDIRKIETRCGVPEPELMQRAAQAALEVALKIASEKRDVRVLAGPGHTGGDARIVAERLTDRF